MSNVATTGKGMSNKQRTVWKKNPETLAAVSSFTDSAYLYYCVCICSYGRSGNCVQKV